jgi:hypothetical protein
MNRRGFLLASLLALPPLLARQRDANAHTARLLTLEDLIDRSTYVVVGTAGERRSVWEELPSGKRIVTYTKIAVERAVAGAPAGDLWVRTLGGAVDKIGQAVPGEAQLPAGSRALLFLAQIPSGAVVVTAMSQGHYPIVLDAKGVARLVQGPDVGLLVGRPGPVIAAHERLVGATVDDAAALVKQIRKARDEKK